MTEQKKDTNQHINDSETMDKLRDRTDELELIISSLTIFALLSLPGWLFSKISSVYTHLSISWFIVGNIGSQILAGVSYGLAACFILHLVARAYWVGLIGLRSAFPDGINWSNTPGLGPMSRKHYRDTLPHIDIVIEKTDRFASSLFAVISLLTLNMLWFGAILTGCLVLAGTIGERFGAPNFAMGVCGLVLASIFIGAPVLLYLLDAQLASRMPRLLESRLYGAFVRLLRHITGLAYPRRLVLPVQLTLQSNTRPFVVFATIVFSTVIIAVVGGTSARSWNNFTISEEFSYLGGEQVAQGFRSTYYEDMPSSLDRLNGLPRVDSFNQNGSFVRLFLPYQPLRDNLVLDQLCGSADQAPNKVDCLRKLWEVSIDGTLVPMSNFEPAERADIGMRGLIGLVPTLGLDPGLHKIQVIWNPQVADDSAPIDDRFDQAKFTYVIPISFAPGYELSLEP